jgi:hypothetical protein
MNRDISHAFCFGSIVGGLQFYTALLVGGLTDSSFAALVASWAFFYLAYRGYKWAIAPKQEETK